MPVIALTWVEASDSWAHARGPYSLSSKSHSSVPMTRPADDSRTCLSRSLESGPSWRYGSEGASQFATAR